MKITFEGTDSKIKNFLRCYGQWLKVHCIKIVEPSEPDNSELENNIAENESDKVEMTAKIEELNSSLTELDALKDKNEALKLEVERLAQANKQEADNSSVEELERQLADTKEELRLSQANLANYKSKLKKANEKLKEE